MYSSISKVGDVFVGGNGNNHKGKVCDVLVERNGNNHKGRIANGV